MQKNKILLVSGIADTFFSPHSRRKLEYGFELAEKIQTLVDNTSNYFGFINLTIPTDKNNDVYVFKNKRTQRVINLTLHSEKLLDVVNEVKLVEEDNSSLLLNGNQLDYILPSKDFEIHLCGVDINGVYVNFIKELLEKGYVVYLYSDLIKRYRDTENNIKTIKHPNFKYCSHKSVK